MGKIQKLVKGSPYKIGGHVKVILAADDTFNSKFIDAVGRVVHFDYSCGCGQSFPSDPMIGVEFDNMEIEEFWKEELTKL